MKRLMTEEDDRLWTWLYDRCGSKLAYRTRRLLLATFRRDHQEQVRWGLHLNGARIELHRMIVDRDWPYDQEIIEVDIDMLGRLKGFTRYKKIAIGGGRSHDELARALGHDGEPS